MARAGLSRLRATCDPHMGQRKRDLAAMRRVQSPIIFGLENIAALFGRAPDTIRRWRTAEGLPLARGPDGVWMTTIGLIEDWIIARNAVDPYCAGAIFREANPAELRTATLELQAGRARALADKLKPEEISRIVKEFEDGNENDDDEKRA